MPEPAREPEVLTARQEDERTLDALGLTPAKAAEPLPGHVQRVAEDAAAAEETLAAVRSVPEPGDDEDELSPGEAWAVMASRRRDSVLQPPETLVPAAPQITEAQASADREAGE
jgi:hypothetical protein